MGALLRYCSIISTRNVTHAFFTWDFFNTPYLHFCLSSDSKTELKCTFSHNKQTLNRTHSLTSMYHSHLANTCSEFRKSCACQKSALYKMRVRFSKPVHAARVRIGPPGANHDQPTGLTATMRTTPCGQLHPHPPVPPFMLTQNL